MMVGQLMRVKSEMHYESKETHNPYYAVYFSGLALGSQSVHIFL